MSNHGRPESLVESIDRDQYLWVDLEFLRTISIYYNMIVVECVDIEVGPTSNWSLSPILSNRWICGLFEGCSIPFLRPHLLEIGNKIAFDRFRERGA